MADHKLSLFSAIIINVNTMLGTGLFLNSVLLASYAGGLCPLSYAIVGLTAVPLIIAFAVLLDYHEAGDFYTIVKSELGVFSGFLSTWIFFISRAVALGLLIHFETFIVRELFPVLQQYPHMLLDFILLFILVACNLFNMRIGSGIQASFTVVKFTAVAIIMTLGIWYFNGANFSLVHLKFSGLPLTIPIVLFAYLGFDTTVSLSKHIENPKRNGPRAILYSFVIVIAVYCLYQFFYYAALNLDALAAVTGDFGVIILFMQSTLKSMFLQNFLHVCVGIAAISGTYGVMFGNIWNLHSLVDNKLIVASDTLAKKNSSGIAYWCLFVEAAICILAIIVGSKQEFIQILVTLGSAIVYTFTMAAFLRIALKKTRVFWHALTAICALAVCAVYLVTSVQGLWQIGVTSLLYLVLLLATLGVVLFFVKKWQVRQA